MTSQTSEPFYTYKTFRPKIDELDISEPQPIRRTGDSPTAIPMAYTMWFLQRPAIELSAFPNETVDIPVPIKTFTNDENSNKRSLLLSLENSQLLDLFTALDEHIVKLIMKNHKTFCLPAGPRLEEYARTIYHSCIRRPNEGTEDDDMYRTPSTSSSQQQQPKRFQYPHPLLRTKIMIAGKSVGTIYRIRGHRSDLQTATSDSQFSIEPSDYKAVDANSTGFVIVQLLRLIFTNNQSMKNANNPALGKSVTVQIMIRDLRFFTSQSQFVPSFDLRYANNFTKNTTTTPPSTGDDDDDMSDSVICCSTTTTPEYSQPEMVSTTTTRPPHTGWELDASVIQTRTPASFEKTLSRFDPSM